MNDTILPENPQIPKVIHYCWFGGNPLPELAQKCIESWKKYCPSYVIKEWNETNFNIDACAYVREAYDAQKWAFVSDYVRFWVLFYEGGLYFDTDVELIQPIDDLIEKGSFMGCEPALIKNNNLRVTKSAVNPGLGLAATPGLGLYKTMLEFYEGIHFLKDDGSNDLTTVVEYTTIQLQKLGWTDKSVIQEIDRIFIYPTDYFCPMSYKTGEITLTENTRSIHHYSATWKNKKEQKLYKNVQKINRVFGNNVGVILGKVYTFPYRVVQKVKIKGIKGTIVFFLKKYL